MIDMRIIDKSQDLEICASVPTDIITKKRIDDLDWLTNEVNCIDRL